MQPLLSIIRTLVFFIFTLALAACTPAPLTIIPLSTESSLFVLTNSASLSEYTSDLILQRNISLDLPCPLIATHAAPRGRLLALELSCVNGPLVQIMDTSTGQARTPFIDMDSHFLAWDFDNQLYLRVDALGNARLEAVTLQGNTKQFDLPIQTYDMDFAPHGQSLIYALTHGLGLGSELWSATSTANRNRQIHTDRNSIITFARWSPDGQRIAFIKMSDSATPFPTGELWVMDADGGNPYRLAPTDAGHGYAAAWSPDSTHIAYVGRENPDDITANQSASALISNIYIVDIASKQITTVTRFQGVLVEAPIWSADGHFLAFSVVSLNDTINVWLADLSSGMVVPLENNGPTCCPAWVRQ